MLIERLESLANNIELSLAAQALLSDTKGLDSSNSAKNESKPFSFAQTDYDEFNWGEEVSQKSPLSSMSSQDLVSLVAKKGSAITTLIKKVQSGILTDEEMATLIPEKRDEVKFFSVVIMILKIIGETGVINTIIDFIREAKSHKSVPQVDTPNGMHKLLESSLLHVMERDVVPLLDKHIPGGTGTISLILQQIKS